MAQMFKILTIEGRVDKKRDIWNKYVWKIIKHQFKKLKY